MRRSVDLAARIVRPGDAQGESMAAIGTRASAAAGGLWHRVVRLGCPVCFTGDDPVVRDSLSAGIGVLMGVTLVVLACFAVFFVVLARRARAAASTSDGDPGARVEGALPAGLDGVPGGAC